MAAPAPGTPRRENAFTRHVGPLPMWGWLAIVASAVLLWAWYEHAHGASASTGAATAAPEVIQTTPPTINITNPGGPGPAHHHNRHRPRTMPGGVNPGGLNDPGPGQPHPARHKHKKTLHTVHRPKSRRHHGNENVGPHKRKRKPKILNSAGG